KYYINYILTALGEKGRDYHCAITFWADKPSESFYEILRNELPNDAEVIRMDEHRFLLFSENSSASMVKLLREMIQSAADSYDELHPEEKINLVITHNNRDRNETIEDFIHMAAEM
ncbi:MAG: hypothetical protein J6N76_04005, partial [Lachnospiraceae bacterium]|nr:hypothetical protein [Lachnospiraceae bacterium]